MTPLKRQFQFGSQTVIIETGEIARQASGSVMVRMGDTVVMVTAVGKSEAAPGRDFFPLTVNYQERTYAAGKIPGGFFKREGRPSEKETLTSRLIDRPLRPLFPKGFYNDVQVIATVVSLDKEINPDIPALIGASAAVALSGVPFAGPVGAARVGYIDGEYVLNPTLSQMADTQLDLVVAGTDQAVLMVESEAKQLSEQVMLDAVIFGHEAQQVVIENIQALVADAARPVMEWTPVPLDQALTDAVSNAAEAKVASAYQVQEKQARQNQLGAIRDGVLADLVPDDGGQWAAQDVQGAVSALEKRVVRGRIIAGEPRIDGRDSSTVRDVRVGVGVLPRTHGSALFTRGETQALVLTTLGTGRDAQIIDELQGERKDPLMFHYNFPPSCVGETGMVGSPKRREIGHGRLARRGISAVLPDMETFPYVIRIVSEITESNGSSSMASVCGASLSLMDAGVPIEAPVAGIAMGLVKDGDRFAILTDILGDEDHLGDMDFKVAGTTAGVTALQMDIKIDGITREIMSQALEQAKSGRMHILEEMAKVITQPRQDISDFAPRILTMKINPDKIRDVIGKGGATIRALTEETGATIDITDDGTIKIASVDNQASQEAVRRIEQLTAEVEVGAIYEGRVAKLMDFGAFVTILPGKDGLVHISQISEERVENVSDKLSEGETVKVKVMEIDKQGRIRLSMKAIS